MKNLVALVLKFGLAAQSLWASVPDRKHLEKIRNEVSQCMDDGRHVSVETNDNRKFAGTITQAGNDDFMLTNAAGTTALNYIDVKKIKSPMDPHKRSVIVSVVVLGGLFGTLLAAAAKDKETQTIEDKQLSANSTERGAADKAAFCTFAAPDFI